MPTDKSTDDSEITLGGSEDTDLASAMQEAVEAVERREGPAPEPKASANDVVTEALISAKKELEGVLEQTKKEAEHLREKWLRAAADFENYKKRVVREREEVVKFGNEKLLKDFLPIIDDMELALAAVSQIDDKEQAADQLMDGVRLVLKKFMGQLERNQVTTFDSVGEVFDPTVHEAVQQINADMEPGRVAQQLQRGFKLNDRLLRPSMVVVSLGPADPAPEPKEDDAGSETS